MQQKKIAIFDFDGVIADTAQLHFSLNKKIDPALTWKKFSALHEGNIYHTLHQQHHKEELEQHIAYFFDLYRTMLDSVQFFGGITEQIAYLKERGYALFIVTSSQEDCVVTLLEKYNMQEMFAGIYGMETHRSKVHKLQQIKKEYSTAQMVFITDTLGDLREAHTVGLASGAVLWGLHTRDLLAVSAPTFFIERPTHLARAIEAHQ